MECFGDQYWSLFYIGIVLGAYLAWVWFSDSRAVSGAIGVLLAQWWLFNLLHDSCNWTPWGNILADTLLCWLAHRLWVRRKSWLLGFVTLVIIGRIMWHAAWGVAGIDGLLYAQINNSLYFLACIAVITEIGRLALEKLRHGRRQ